MVKVVEGGGGGSSGDGQCDCYGSGVGAKNCNDACNSDDWKWFVIGVGIGFGLLCCVPILSKFMDKKSSNNTLSDFNRGSWVSCRKCCKIWKEKLRNCQESSQTWCDLIKECCQSFSNFFHSITCYTCGGNSLYSTQAIENRMKVEKQRRKMQEEEEMKTIDFELTTTNNRETEL